jgi:hypothetical protein
MSTSPAASSPGSKPSKDTPAARYIRWSIPPPDHAAGGEVPQPPSEEATRLAAAWLAERTAAVHTVISYSCTADSKGQASIQAQRADLEAEAAFHGWQVAAWIDDLGQSGTTLERPGLTRALELLDRHQADALLVCEPTRLSRSAAVTRQLAAHAAAYGWQVVIVSDDRQLVLFGHQQGA